MVDIESYVFTEIATMLREKYGKENIFITGEYVHAPSKFPAISIVQEDDYLTHEHLDSSADRTYRTLMFEVNVYTNKTVGKKSQAKEILGLINDKMYRMNFVRTITTQVPNAEDGTIFRIVGRYRAETDGETIYRR